MLSSGERKNIYFLDHPLETHTTIGIVHVTEGAQIIAVILNMNLDLKVTDAKSPTLLSCCKPWNENELDYRWKPFPSCNFKSP